MSFYKFLTIGYLSIISFSALSQPYWHRTIGGDSLYIKAEDVFSVDTGNFWVTGKFFGVFDFHEGSSLQPYIIESLPLDGVHDLPSYYLCNLNSEGEVERMILLHPEDPSVNIELDRISVIRQTDDSEVIIHFSEGWATGSGLLDIDPGPQETLVTPGVGKSHIVKYDSDDELMNYGVGYFGEDHHAVPAEGGFFIHANDEYNIMNISLLDTLEVEVPSASGSAAVVAKYDDDLGLLWHHVVGLEPGSYVNSEGVHQLSDGRVIWLVRCNQGMVDMDPTPNVDMLSGLGIIVYDSSGNYLSSYVFDIELGNVYSVESTGQNEVRLYGVFDGLADFDLGPGLNIAESYGNHRDFFIASYTSDFELNWFNISHGSSSVSYGKGNLEEVSNGLTINHSPGNRDLDADSTGFLLVNSKGFAVLKTSPSGRVKGYFDFNYLSTNFAFTSGNRHALYTKNHSASHPLLTVNGAVAQDAVTSGANALGLVGLHFEGLSLARGACFLDLNNNGLWDSGESALVGHSITCLENSMTSITNDTGGYVFCTSPGDYSLVLSMPPHHELSSGQSFPIQFTLEADTTLTVDDIAVHPIPNITDVLAETPALLSPMNPGFYSELLLEARNIGTVEAETDLVLYTPDIINVTDIQPSPAIQTSDSIVWEGHSIAYMEQESFRVGFVTDTNVALIGDSALFEVKVSTSNDINIINNEVQRYFEIIGSYDPNDKSVYPSEITLDELSVDDNGVLKYLIRFQNTGSAPTSFVHIIDTLPASLNLSTFRMISSSHPLSFDITEDRVVTWSFDPLELPDSATDPQGSIGYIQFEIELADGFVNEFEISNEAYIYFDFNPPILTEPAILSISQETSVEQQKFGGTWLQAYPNPFTIQTQLNYRTVQGMQPTLQLKDMLGRIVQTVPLPSNEGTYTLAAAELGTGIYFCTLLNGTEVMATQKLVVAE